MEPSAAPDVPEFGDKAATILATEHWSLLATRSMGWNEAFSRTSVFLNVMSAAAVALALVADATGFGDTFNLFAMVLFPLVLFMGLGTFIRLVQINRADVLEAAAMNRLRAAYLDIAPELRPYFSTGSADDLPGVVQTFSLGGPSTKPWVQFFITTPTLVATVNAIIAAAGSALVAARIGLGDGALIAVAGVMFLVVWLVLFRVQLGIFLWFRNDYVARFPTPE